MSMQFGQWRFDGQPQQNSMDRAEVFLAPFGPDGRNLFMTPGISILFRALHTTRESAREVQPYESKSGKVFTWDGRLDNREQLIRELRETGDLAPDAPDVRIVASAYDRWGRASLGKFIGDWALSVWDPILRSLVLAKDVIGTRPLYYTRDKDQLAWSSILDPLVLLERRSLQLNEEYLAGCLSFFPAAHLTPYDGIHSVPPSSYVHFSVQSTVVKEYWRFDPNKTIRYRTDAEYEGHFCLVFAESVRRRLRSANPVLAELSGGMDSSSIVCVADALLRHGAADTPRLDTISYYNDTEPNWNERPYFTRVEQERRRTGCHIDVGAERPSILRQNGFTSTPCHGRSLDHIHKQFAACLAAQDNRVVLSGTGGDEVMGGVPTPVPELADLLSKGQVRILAHQLKLWALAKRKPWFHLLLEAACRFFPPGLTKAPRYKEPAAWFHSEFVRRNRLVFRGYETRWKLFGLRPSFQASLSTLNVLRRQLACEGLPSSPPYEKRYPYLDRDLLEFLYAVPREQLVRPNQRRSLMRRALASIVPPEILNRKRKAFAVRSPILSLSTEWSGLVELSNSMISASERIVDARPFFDTLEKARDGLEVPIVTLMRTIRLELWLRTLREQQILSKRSGAFSRPDLRESF